MDEVSYLNEYQEQFCRRLASTPPEQLCWCGWFWLGFCLSCNEAHPGLTAADKQRERDGESVEVRRYTAVPQPPPWEEQ